MIPAFFWGTTYAVAQYTLPDWPPFLLGALRALPAGLILLWLKPTRPTKGDVHTLFTLGLVNIAAFFSLIFVMAMTLPSAISGVGMISVPVFAMLFHWLMRGKAPSLIQAFSGVVLVLLAWQLFDPGKITLSPFGLAAMLIAIMCIVFGSGLTKSLGGRIHWWTVLTWQLLFGGAILAMISLVHAVISPAPYLYAIEHISWLNVAGLAWIILLNTALGYGLYVWLLKRMSVVDFTFGGIANPVAGIVAGLVLLNETYSVHQYLLMAGMILMSLLPQIYQLITVRLFKPSHC
ncbi:EamA-like transporter family protein [Vibrio xiamenensis]|uniref:EamA-like transporter family protein n=2 Tax=Vibrio xiamenensis TaxID=861298 RepID=A0A1G8A1L6_9VIBR|nr:EamA-like transporter family protein [Vibrio xiamenensis]